jgi:hypothetical protein
MPLAGTTQDENDRRQRYATTTAQLLKVPQSLGLDSEFSGKLFCSP